jgi:hypothetical protein
VDLGLGGGTNKQFVHVGLLTEAEVSSLSLSKLPILV